MNGRAKVRLITVMSGLCFAILTPALSFAAEAATAGAALSPSTPSLINRTRFIDRY